jgi:hypothetical protein
MKKRVVIDTSSAILLFKSGWMGPVMACYRAVIGPMVFREMTVGGYPGAAAFSRWQSEKRIIIENAQALADDPTPGRGRLDPGEQECIDLYHSGAGSFLIIDDGRGAAHCRRQGIPFINALLVPRLLQHASVGNGADWQAALLEIFRIGRYAPWVKAYALSCPDDHLALFRP